jgi:hypothetical protein
MIAERQALVQVKPVKAASNAPVTRCILRAWSAPFERPSQELRDEAAVMVA